MTIVNPSIPLEPPVEWFSPPETMEGDAGCVVEPNGRIYGYLCHWKAVLMDGRNDKWTPPRSKTNYSYAHTGDTICSNGTTIKTANLGGDAGHAKIDPYETDRTTKLQAFYEDTSTQLARVRYGEDDNGVWFAGVCWPTVTDIDMAKLRASARSGHWAALGDWRDMNSGRAGYELVGACLVNVPGLKYARADRAASGVLSLNPFSPSDSPTEMVKLIGGILSNLAAALNIPTEQFAATPYATIAILDDRERQWDAVAAEERVREWANAQDAPIESYSKAFLWYDGDNPDVFDSYKLQFADIVDGELRAIPRGVFAVAAILQENREGISGVTDTELETLQANVAKYYDNMATAFDDPSLVAPWVENLSIERVASSGNVTLSPSEVESVEVSGVLVVENQPTEDGRFIEPGAITWRDVPLPLYAKLENTEGHDEAQLVGRIDTIERSTDDSNKIVYTGTIRAQAGEGYGQRVLDAVSSGELGGVSIDGIGGPDDSFVDDDGIWHMTSLVIAGATLTPMPAIHDATVTIGLSTQGATMATDIELAETTDDAAVGAEDENVSAEEQTEATVALGDQVAALSDRVEYLIGIVESSQMGARLAAIASREKELGI